MEKIVIKDAYENNLKHISLDIPVNSFTCVTGCSGCGKSSLVFDTIYAESQRGFLEGMTGNIQGQKLMNKPKVGAIENLRPALNISQNYYNVNPRSTIGTTTEISYYLRALFAMVNSVNGETVPENVFSSNNPKSFCPHCAGLGIETVVSERLLIPDRKKTLRDGAILFFKGPSGGKNQKMLEALCDHYGIDIDKSVSKLNKKELETLLYANDDIKYKLLYKEGKKRKSHFVHLNGAVTAINEYFTKIDASVTNVAYSQYMEDIPCHVCGGTKLREDILKYKVNGLNYSEVEQMEFTELRGWVQKINDKRITGEKKSLVLQLVKSITVKIDALISLNVGYLCLNRPIPTLSGGERQRIRIANQLTCSLKGLIYILDEPCKGLHYRDTANVIKATKDLISRENTVIAIEHNKQYISSADNIIELGPVGGPEGGYLIKQKKASPPKNNKLKFKEYNESEDNIRISGINFRNIKNQEVQIPIGKITCITGVSGSGKSSLAEVVNQCFLYKAQSCCESFLGNDAIKRVLRVNQSPIGKTPRSTVISYLDIYDEIRTLFAATSSAKEKKINASMFSMNVKGERCECCQGTGMQKIELNYLPSTYITCPECNGKRFSEKLLSVQYNGLNMYYVLETPVSEIIDVFEGTKKVYPVLESMIQLGLGYLKLGQMSMSLSGGEAQRVKLAKALGIPSSGRNLYILDEPTTGLNDKDIDKFVDILLALSEKKDTIMIIEHNIEFIARVADYVVDFGTSGGEAGGVIAVQGKPEAAFKNKNSSLYKLDTLVY